MNLTHRDVGGINILTGDGVQYQDTVDQAAYDTAYNDPANTIIEYNDTQEALDDAKSLKLKDINVKKDAEIDKDITFQTVVYQASYPTREAATEAALEAMIDPAFTVDWIAKDNSLVNMDDTKIKDFSKALSDQSRNSRYNARTHKNAVEALANDTGETIADRVVSVTAYDYSTGW